MVPAISSGNYAGAQARAPSVGVGVGANVLVGGSRRLPSSPAAPAQSAGSVVLNVAAGLAEAWMLRPGRCISPAIARSKVGTAGFAALSGAQIFMAQSDHVHR